MSDATGFQAAGAMPNYQLNLTSNTELQLLQPSISCIQSLPPIDTDLQLHSFDDSNSPYNAPSTLFGNFDAASTSQTSLNVQSPLFRETSLPAHASPVPGWPGSSHSPSSSTAESPSPSLPTKDYLVQQYKENIIKSRKGEEDNWELQFPPSPLSPRVTPLPLHDVLRQTSSYSYDYLATPSIQPAASSSHSNIASMPASSSDLGATSTRSCPGIVVQWPPELELNFNETFPFHRVPIGRSNGDLPFYIELQDGGKKIVAWSKTCTRRLTPFASHCHECDKVVARLDRLGSMAEHAEKGTNYRFLSHSIFVVSLNMSRQLATFARKMGDYERLVMAIAENDVPRINALLNTALQNGASVNTIIAQITETVQRLRSTKGFPQFEHDLSLLIYRIGGNSLLYSLNHALGLPSLRTIGNSAHFVKIAPSFGPVSIDEIRVNIQKVILEPRALVGNTQKKAVVIMMDEVALEEHLDYFPMQNKVGGLCQKHSGTIPLELKAYTSVLAIVDKLRDGTVHFGKEMAVVARESVEDMEKIYNLLMAAWEELGEQTYGEIRNFATVDRRMFCKEEIPKDHPLFRILSNLPGLNLFTGPKLILQTFDWRHIVKRHSTVVRQPSGMCVDAGRVVNPHFLAQCLELLDDHDEKSVHKLLNPDDPQDVPRAIDLIEAIISLREIEIPQHNVDLSYTADSVRLLGHGFENFTLPFITPEFNLSRQICMLSTCAHIIFVLFREYRLDFMSNQLYGDTQSTIKNIVFSVGGAIVPYQSVIGSAMYAMLGTRPDLAYSVGVLGRYSAKPKRIHWAAAKRLLRYLKGTRHWELVYNGADISMDMQFLGYSDANWNGDRDTSRSTSGYVFIVNSGAIGWSSRRQFMDNIQHG
ncbi:hypothetical protein R3P38DRAFT_3206912 [Favolaschia claudopus]|uniref:Uncharacterized protein n=1 Tax=Favolaschia claudopus TaxID=2862362 RepID=A0AAW0AK35_9AGAR